VSTSLLRSGRLSVHPLNQRLLYNDCYEEIKSNKLHA